MDDNRKIFKEYEKQGYEVIVSRNINFDYVVMEIDDEDVHKLLKNGFFSDSIISDDRTLIVKCNKPYHITPIDILDIFEKETEDETEEILCALRDYKSLFLPKLESTYYKTKWNKDCFFDDDDHLVHFVINAYRKRENDFLSNKISVISFIDDILLNRNLKLKERKYKDSTTDILVKVISDQLYFKTKLNKAHVSFYKTKLEELANKGFLLQMEELGYNYYSGTNGYEVDFYKAEYWLKKTFEINNNPSISRSLGYIYYYGRANHGVPEGDKAFEYFSHSHFVGGYFEATYKLADCYLKGYGTFKSEAAAFSIVKSILEENRVSYLKCNNSKYADVALRIGTYFLDGIGCDVDYQKALFFLLEARDAIKLRFKDEKDSNDISVAFNIRNQIEKVKKCLNVKPRKIIDGGYLLEDYDGFWNDSKIKVDRVENGYFHIKIKQKSPYINVIGGDESIYYRERTNVVEFLVKLVDEEDAVFLKRRIGSIKFDYDEIFFLYKDREYISNYLIEKLIYIPNHLKNLEQNVLLAKVELLNGVTQYECYSPIEVNVGEIVTAKINNQEVPGKVIETKLIYEDELPLPIEEMYRLVF